MGNGYFLSSTDWPGILNQRKDIKGYSKYYSEFKMHIFKQVSVINRQFKNKTWEYHEQKEKQYHYPEKM